MSDCKFDDLDKEYKKLEEAYLKAFGLIEQNLLSDMPEKSESDGEDAKDFLQNAGENRDAAAKDIAAVRDYMDMSIFELSDKIGSGIRVMSKGLAADSLSNPTESIKIQPAEAVKNDGLVSQQSKAKSDANANKQGIRGENAPKEKELKASATESEDTEPEKTADELLAEMDALVGLDTVKKDIRSMINFIRVCKLREERGMKAPKLSYHMVFSGNPGTGKTTIARMLAQLYKAIGILPKGQLVEVDRSGLIAGYQGQTAIKTAEVLESAMGGVLFIDEAYALVDNDTDTYGKECIATILKAMEDHRDELIVIVAGYDELMHKFIDSNPGFKSRFNKYIHFPDYSGEELEKIFLLQCKSNGYELEAEARKLLRAVFDDWYETRDENFGNGRTVRNSFEKIINCQASRLAAGTEITDDELRTLTLQDVKDGLELSPEDDGEGQK